MLIIICSNSVNTLHPLGVVCVWLITIIFVIVHRVLFSTVFFPQLMYTLFHFLSVTVMVIPSQLISCGIESLGQNNSTVVELFWTLSSSRHWLFSLFLVSLSLWGVSLSVWAVVGFERTEELQHVIIFTVLLHSFHISPVPFGEGFSVEPLLPGAWNLVLLHTSLNQ